MADTKLDIVLIEGYNISTLALGDISMYASTPTNPIIEITPPGWVKATPVFNPNNINLYTSSNLNTSCAAGTPLPDGQYDVRYSVDPSSQYFVEKSFFRTSLIKCKYQRTLLALDATCPNNKAFQNALQEARILIEGCIASANQCDFTAAYDKYKLAESLLNNISKCNCQ